jgi:branched-chain amino acid transport system permease protein
MINFTKRPVEVIATLALLVLLVVAPMLGSRQLMYNLTLVAIFACPVIGLNLLLGLAGQVSFAQVAFMAIGGYGSALMTTRLGIDPWAAMGLSALLAIFVAVIVGLPLFRLKAHYFAMSTYALGMGTFSFATAADWLTNGSIGISGIPPLVLGSLSLGNPWRLYFLAWIVCVLFLLIVAILANSHIGRAWRALAAGPEIASALGVNLVRYKLLAFVIAAFMASVAGSLYVEFTSFVGPDLYDIKSQISIFLMLFIGGPQSLIGPVIGSMIFTFVPQWIASTEQLQNLIFYVFLLVLLLVRPAGILGDTPIYQNLLRGSTKQVRHSEGSTRAV